MDDVRVLGLILALALGLVSLALAARVPRRETPPDVTWLPVTLLLYNLWLAGFLATGYLFDRVVPPAASAPASANAAGLALLALSLAWLYAHVAQVFALLGASPPSGARRAARYLPIGLGVVFAGSWLLSRWTGNSLIFLVPAGVVRVAVFPAALVASLFFLQRSRRFRDAAWRPWLSGLAMAYVGLFSCLFALEIGWSRLAAVSPDLPVAFDLILELLYNVVAIVWLMRLAVWLRRMPEVHSSRLAETGRDRTQVLARCGVTKREAEIVDLICLGKTNQEIADQLFIALATVKDHNYVIFQKLAVRNRTELTRLVLGARDAIPR